MSDSTVLDLKVIAAMAEKAADDLKHGRLWEGQLFDVVASISRVAQQLLANTPRNR